MAEETPKCSPDRKRSKSSCFKKKELVEIVDQYKGSKQIDPRKKKREELIDYLKTFFKDVCNTEKCWIRKTNLSHLEDIFRVDKPAEWAFDPFTWLTTSNIYNVMVQYENAFPKFKYLGTMPADFEEYTDGRICVGVCDFKIKEAKQYECFGAVLNYDVHTMSGSHWVAIFINKNPTSKMYGIYYFDSSGKPPFYHAERFMKRIHADMADAKFEIRYNTIRKQFQRTECGIFSIYFLQECLEGKKTFDQLCESMPTDNIIQKYRNVFFY
jgi:hypothetical protein